MRIIWILGGFFLFCLSSLPVSACSPTPTPSPIPYSGATPSPISVEERAQTAPIIFVGTVVNGELCNSTYSRYLCEAEIEVEVYLKGTGAALVWVTGFGVGTDCYPIIELGERRVFFLEGNPNGSLRVLYFYYSNAMLGVTDEIIAQISAITNQSTIPEAMPVESRLRLVGNRFGSWGLAFGLICFGIVMGGIFWAWRRGRRKTKAKRETL